MFYYRVQGSIHLSQKERERKRGREMEGGRERERKEPIPWYLFIVWQQVHSKPAVEN